MSFFDFIDLEPEEQSQESPQQPENDGIILEPSNPIETKTENIRHRSKIKPEKLKFLKPCPLCECRDFVCTEKGDFFCVQSKPGKTGSPVIAAGNWDMLEVAPAPDPIKQPTPEPEPESRQDSKEESRPNQMDTHGLSFKIAFPWLTNHINELLQDGWTRPALFGRGKHRFPLGAWGVVWFSHWSKENVQVDICQRSGAIRFTFPGTDGRPVIQAAYPPPRKKHQ